MKDDPNAARRAAAEELRENVLFMRANGIPAELVVSWDIIVTSGVRQARLITFAGAAAADAALDAAASGAALGASDEPPGSAALAAARNAPAVSRVGMAACEVAASDGASRAPAASSAAAMRPASGRRTSELNV